MRPDERERLAEENSDAVLFEGLDESLIGCGGQYTRPPLAVVHSVRRIIEARARAWAESMGSTT